MPKAWFRQSSLSAAGSPANFARNSVFAGPRQEILHIFDPRGTFFYTICRQ
jgi:hypothetical protein